MMPWTAIGGSDVALRSDDLLLTTPTDEDESCKRDGGAARQINVAMAKWFFALKDDRPFPEFRGSAAEPAWDILIDLYMGELLGRRTSVTSACIGSRVPPTTALRHLNALCEAKRIERLPDENDARRCWLRLSPEAVRAIDRYLGRAGRFP